MKKNVLQIFPRESGQMLDNTNAVLKLNGKVLDGVTKLEIKMDCTEPDLCYAVITMAVSNVVVKGMKTEVKNE